MDGKLEAMLGNSRRLRTFPSTSGHFEERPKHTNRPSRGSYTKGIRMYRIYSLELILGELYVATIDGCPIWDTFAPTAFAAVILGRARMNTR